MTTANDRKNEKGWVPVAGTKRMIEVLGRLVRATIWKNLLLRTCSTLLWEGERGGKKVAGWGGRRNVMPYHDYLRL